MATAEHVWAALLAILHGLDFSKVQLVCAWGGKQALTRHYFDKAVVIVENYLLGEAKASMESLIMLEPTPLSVLSDCGWNQRGSESPMGVITFIGATTMKVVAVCPLINASKYLNFSGSSKAMEGEGTDRICQTLRQQKRTVGTFLHDGDSSSVSAIRKYFPESVEQRCVNHYCKNFGKWAKTHPSLGEKWYRRLQTALKAAILEASSKQDPKEALRLGLQKCLRHYKGDHSTCEHKFSIDPKDSMTAQQLGSLHVKFSDILKEADLIVHGRNQSVCESFNNLVCQYAPKTTNSPQLYLA